jgi:hypothetical protein
MKTCFRSTIYFTESQKDAVHTDTRTNYWQIFSDNMWSSGENSHADPSALQYQMIIIILRVPSTEA